MFFFFFFEGKKKRADCEYEDLKGNNDQNSRSRGKMVFISSSRAETSRGLSRAAHNAEAQPNTDA